jgi:hypothetical protein
LRNDDHPDDCTADAGCVALVFMLVGDAKRYVTELLPFPQLKLMVSPSSR